LADVSGRRGWDDGRAGLLLAYSGIQAQRRSNAMSIDDLWYKNAII